MHCLSETDAGRLFMNDGAPRFQSARARWIRVLVSRIATTNGEGLRGLNAAPDVSGKIWKFWNLQPPTAQEFGIAGALR